MPVFYQHQINENTRMGVWKIEESESFFRGNVPLHRDVTHPHKRLQHLAGRFMLQFLFPDFPYELIQIADTRKPFLPDEQYHFSISHCGDYAAAIVSRSQRVGIDVELVRPMVEKLIPKFLSEKERNMLGEPILEQATLFWSAKEAVFKWFGNGAVDFRNHIHLLDVHTGSETIDCSFTKDTNMPLEINYRVFDGLVLTWVGRVEGR